MSRDVAERRQRGLALQRERADSGETGLRRLMILSSFNTDLMPPFMVEAMARAGIAVDVKNGDFGQIAAQILNPQSELYAEDPGDVLMVPAPEDLLAPLYGSVLAPADQEELVTDRLDELKMAVSALLERLPDTTCYVVAFGTGRAPSGHILDPTAPARGQTAVTRFTDGVRELARLSPRVIVVDWDWHVRAVGSAGFVDERLWYLARMRLNPEGLSRLADLVARHVAAYHGSARKVAAIDLDGTLWGGVVGEVGLSGVDLGEEGTGLAFQDFQRELVRLRDAGVVLVACSKNNRDDVVDLFERHPAMIIELSDFASERINWQDKATNLREIAADLQLGLDSFVFFDDNPVERGWIEQALPEVAVPELPEDPSERPAFLRAGRFFDRVGLTEADHLRAGSYVAQGQRSRLMAGSTSFGDFLRSLDQEVIIESVNDATLARAAQLCQRTNQFNLTTRRHTVADLERMMVSEDRELYVLSVRDRFGDSGITGLAILVFDDGRAEIETFLLSCRVLGRRVEDALLAFLGDRTVARGAERLVGQFLPTDRNMQAAAFLPERGFEDAGEGMVALELTGGGPPMPGEMSVKVDVNA